MRYKVLTFSQHMFLRSFHLYAFGDTVFWRFASCGEAIGKNTCLRAQILLDSWNIFVSCITNKIVESKKFEKTFRKTMTFHSLSL